MKTKYFDRKTLAKKLYGRNWDFYEMNVNSSYTADRELSEITISDISDIYDKILPEMKEEHPEVKIPKIFTDEEYDSIHSIVMDCYQFFDGEAADNYSADAYFAWANMIKGAIKVYNDKICYDIPMFYFESYDSGIHFNTKCFSKEMLMIHFFNMLDLQLRKITAYEPVGITMLLKNSDLWVVDYIKEMTESYDDCFWDKFSVRIYEETFRTEKCNEGLTYFSFICKHERYEYDFVAREYCPDDEEFPEKMLGNHFVEV